MNEENKNQINKTISNPKSAKINFHKINSIMNQRLDGVLDYLAASVYFSRYNDRQIQKQKNLENFFKSTIFDKKPFIVKNEHKLSNTNTISKKQNKQLNIIVNFRNNQLNIKKNKFTSPYILHSKKTHFLKNMIDFSKNFHSEEKKENDIKKTYPKLITKSLNFRDFSEIPSLSVPNIKKYEPNIFYKKNDLNNKKNNKIQEMSSNKYSNNKNNEIIKLSCVNRIKTSKSFLSLDDGKEKEKLYSKKRLFKKKLLNESSNTKLNYNLSWNNYTSIKSPRKIKLFKANCYYNNLHLLKFEKIFKKNSYQKIN